MGSEWLELGGALPLYEYTDLGDILAMGVGREMRLLIAVEILFLFGATRYILIVAIHIFESLVIALLPLIPKYLLPGRLAKDHSARLRDSKSLGLDILD